MKYIIIFILTIIQTSNVYAVELGIGLGPSFNGVRSENTDPDETARMVYIQSSTPIFLGVKGLRYKSAKKQNNTLPSNFFAVYTGTRIPYNSFFMEGSLGMGYLTNPDGPITSNGRLTNHEQFDIMLSMGFKLNEIDSLKFTINHISNCSNICGRSNKHKPNHGRDYIMINFSRQF